MKIIGTYEDWVIVETNGQHFVVDSSNEKILFVGSKELCTKLFVMLIAGFIKEDEWLKKLNEVGR